MSKGVESVFGLRAERVEDGRVCVRRVAQRPGDDRFRDPVVVDRYQVCVRRGRAWEQVGPTYSGGVPAREIPDGLLVAMLRHPATGEHVSAWVTMRGADHSAAEQLAEED